MTDDAILKGQGTLRRQGYGGQAGDGGQIEDTELLRRYAGEKSEDAFAELVRQPEASCFS